MNEPELHFTSVKIRRLLGFHDDGFDVPRLSPGVNIIYGPNAAGKTTFGLALRHLLWRSPEDIRSISIAGELSYDGRPLVIDIDHGRVTCQQTGRDADPPRVTSSDSAGRYVLALHDLLQDEQPEGSASSFAEHILRETAGGYDIAGAAAKLEFSARPRTRSSQINTALQQAQRQAQDFRQKQQELETQVDELDELHRKREEATAAQRRLAVIAKAEEHLTACEKLREAERTFEAFPPQLAKIDGQEIVRLEEIRHRHDELEQDARGVKQDLSDAQRRIDEAALPEQGISVEQIGIWRGELRRLSELQSRAEEAARRVAEHQSQEESSSRFFGEHGVAAELETVDAAVVAELSGYARRWCQWHVRRDANEEAIRLLKVDESDASADDLRQVASLLDQWLTLIEPSPSVQRTGKFTTAAMAVLAVALVGVLLWHQHGIIGGIVAVVLPFAYRIVKGYLEGIAIDERTRIEQATAAIEAPQPSTWTPDAVRKHRNTVQHAYNAATINQQRAARRRELEDEQRRLKREGEELTSHWDQLAVKTLRLPIAEDDPAFVTVWTSHLCDWQRAHRTRVAAERELETSRGAIESLHRGLCDALAEAGSKCELTIDHLGPTIESLGARQQEVAKAQPIVASCTQRLATIEQQMAQLAESEQAVFEKIALRPEDEATLRRWVESCTDYTQARQNLDFARRQHSVAVESLDDCDAWRDKTREDLATERSRAEQIASEAAEIDRRIGAIEQQVADAKKQHDLEAALVEVDERRQQLRDRRDEDARAMVGNVLANYLKQQQRERDRPLVFRKAQDAFVRITHGRYQLDVDEGDPPQLRAIDTATGRGQALDELSSGTRLQLLLAVRVAYLEQQELGAKLPLIFDETLGNSDERRAGEIIDAAIELCRDGRQLFYLTAQWDEVAKWRTVLKDKYPEVPLAEIDLAERRGFSEQERIPPVELPRMPEPISVPPPTGHDLWSYRGLLGVPAFDPYRPLGATHLWYLVDDPQGLYELLKLGINNWGQLEALAARGGLRLEEVGDGVYPRARASKCVLEAFCTAWKIGRGLPADRAVLQDSGLKPRWIDEVAELSKRLQGDARALIEGLRNREVKRIPSATVDELEGFLQENRYIDEGDPLSNEDIRSRVVSAATEFLNQGLLDPQRIDWLLRVIATPAAETSPSAVNPPHKPQQQRDFTARMTD